jgi:hypothetical protein
MLFEHVSSCAPELGLRRSARLAILHAEAHLPQNSRAHGLLLFRNTSIRAGRVRHVRWQVVKSGVEEGERAPEAIPHALPWTWASYAEGTTSGPAGDDNATC